MNVERLPFDQYQRYRLVADLVLRLAEHVDEPLRVLDVGGRTALLREFLPDLRVELVDLEGSGAEGLVLGDGSALPFASGSFDVVCAFDTLEHVPPALRSAFVDETWRVSRRWVLLAGPYDAPRVREAERLLGRFIRGKLGFAHRYLEEHLEHGLPVRKAVEQQFKSLGGEVLSVGHANLDRWLALMGLELYMDADPALRKLAESVYGFYNRSLYASDHAEPVYRHVVIGAHNGAPLPDLDGLLDPPIAPQGSLAPFTELTQALLAFDKERTVWQDERSAFIRAVAVIEEDLAEHKAVVEKLGAEDEQRKAVLQDLRVDLEGHQSSLQDTTRDAQVAAAGFEEQIEVLTADLAGHRESLKRMAEENRALGAVRDELQGDLDGHRVALVEAQKTIEEWKRHAAEIEADLVGHRAVLKELREERSSAEEEGQQDHGEAN